MFTSERLWVYINIYVFTIEGSSRFFRGKKWIFMADHAGRRIKFWGKVSQIRDFFLEQIWSCDRRDGCAYSTVDLMVCEVSRCVFSFTQFPDKTLQPKVLPRIDTSVHSTARAWERNHTQMHKCLSRQPHVPGNGMHQILYSQCSNLHNVKSTTSNLDP